MSRQDDMVLVPSFELEDDTPTQQEAREGHLTRRVPKGRLARRLRQLHAARQARKAQIARSKMRSRAYAQAGSRGLATAGRAAVARGAGAARAALLNPVAMIATALLVAAVVAIRLAGGQPLEGVGAQINKALLGDADEKARTKRSVRERLLSDPLISQIAAAEGGATDQMVQVFEGLYQSELDTVNGRTMLEERFPIDGTIDHLILRAEQAFRNAWNAGSPRTDGEKLKAGLFHDEPISGRSSPR